MTPVDRTARRSRPARDPSPAASFFQALVESSPDTIFLVDLETEEFMYVSPAVRSLLGREPKEMMGRTLTDFVHPHDASQLLARSAPREGRGVPTAVTRMSHSERGWVWVQATASPVVVVEGRSTAVFTVTGASERVRAELGLRTARLRLRRVLGQVGGVDGHAPLQTRHGMYDLTVEALAAALELRDDETGHHARRVTDFALALARAVDPALAAEPDLRYGFLLHDIGKIGVPDAILLKRSPLTEREARILQRHTTLGEHLLAFIPFVSELAHDVVAYHHERWDGSGYPWGLSGTTIPLAARIFAVADAFDAMTSERPYRNAIEPCAASDELERGAGSQFDPGIVDAFLPIARALGTQPRG